jgi:release factor glutamine methyltransferase
MLRQLHHALQRRLNGEPLAYITGTKEFYGLSFLVSAATLIPRADTEVLVDWVIANAAQNARLLELGTGTGCIAIAVAHCRPDLSWIATDISVAALAIAQQNAVSIAVQERVQLLESNWFAKVSKDMHFDGIVSNPPYIASADKHLVTGDLRFEPRGALTDGHDGLRDIAHIAAMARPHLKPSGFIAIEHGYDQAGAVRTLFSQVQMTQIATHRDLEQRERFTIAYV